MTDFENRLRTGLADAAERAPRFTGFDPDRSTLDRAASDAAGRSRPGGAVSGGAVSGGAVSGGAVSGGAVSGGAVPGGAVSGGDGPRRAIPASVGTRRPDRRRRWLAVAAAVAAVVAVAAGLSWWSAGIGGNGNPQASCAAELVLDGRTYTTTGELLRVPRPGPGLGTGTVPGCDDGGGAAAPEHLKAFRITGVEPDVAVLADGSVWMNENLTAPPATVREFSEPVRCTGGTTMAGTLVAIDGAERTDFRPRTPYTATFEADEGPGLPLDRYSRVTIQLRVTADTAGGRDGRLLRAALSGGDRVSVTVRCDGPRFVATAWELAR